jgi:hypothetical protein
VSIYKELTCADCRGKFIWSANDQELFAERSFSEPKRYKECRQAKKADRGDAGRERRPAR